MDEFKSKVFESVRNYLVKWKEEKDFHAAAETIAKHMLLAVKKDPRVPSNNWDWGKIYQQVFKFVYLAIALSEMNPASHSWADPGWVRGMWEAAREELVPKLVRFKGNVVCEFDAGFKGILPRKKKKLKPVIDPNAPKRKRGRPRKYPLPVPQGLNE